MIGTKHIQFLILLTFHFYDYKLIVSTITVLIIFSIISWLFQPHKKSEKTKMKSNEFSSFSFIISLVLLLQYLSVLCVSQDFDFFYFVQQV